MAAPSMAHFQKKPRIKNGLYTGRDEAGVYMENNKAATAADTLKVPPSKQNGANIATAIAYLQVQTMRFWSAP